MIILFWTLLFFVFYCYFGYPLLITLLAKLRYNTPIQRSNIEPTVSVVIAVYNEDDVISQKIKNLLELDYPADKIEILIGSDASTDKTHQLINEISKKNIKLIINPKRQGKMAILNKLIPLASNEIILFTDARQLFKKDALKKLVSNFSDKTVGCVSGELIFYSQKTDTAKGINLYWQYEKFIRAQESRIHSMLGATGAIYAIRKNLFTAGPTDIVLDDMYTPFKIIKQGYRAIFDETAHAYDQIANNPKEEFRRKTRTLYGNYQIFALCPEMFNPLKSPVAWQLFSHKLLRVMIPFLLIMLFSLNFLLKNHSIYLNLWNLQIGFYLMALIGYLTKDFKFMLFKIISKICYIPYIFCLLNIAALVGFWRFITARQEVTWKKARE